MLAVLSFLLATMLLPLSQSAANINSPDGFMALFPKSAKEVDLGNVWKQLGIAPGKFTVFCNDCLGTVSKHNLSRDLIAVQIWPYNGPARIVFFMRSGTGWAVSGVVDIPGERLIPVQIELRQAGMREWVVLTSAEAEGTGIFAHVVTWYSITPTGLKQVLSYPGDGHLDAGELFMPLGMRYDVQSHFRDLAIETGSGIIRIQLRLNFQFLGDKDFKDLWPGTTVTATFRENSAGMFNLIPSPALDSDRLSEEYFIARHWLTAQEFLNFEHARLRGIASGKDQEKRKWVREFLDQCQADQLCTDASGIAVR